MADDSYTIADIEFPCTSGIATHFTEDGDRYYEMTDANCSGTGRFVAGYCWKICPYSTAWYDKYGQDGYYRRIQIMSGNVKRFIQVRVPHTDQTVHNWTSGRMRYHQVGSRAGFICDDPDCRHKSTYGTKFFEV